MTTEDGNRQDTADQNVNNSKTKANKTMMDQIRGENYSTNPETSYGRSMVA